MTLNKPKYIKDIKDHRLEWRLRMYQGLQRLI